MELVCGQAEHVNVLCLYINVQMAGYLNCVGVEGNTGFLTNRADFSDGQYGTDFVVGIHTGHQTGVLADRVLDLLGGDVVAVLYVQQCDLKALFFQTAQGV